MLKTVVSCVLYSDLQSGALPHIRICKSCQIGSDRKGEKVKNWSFSLSDSLRYTLITFAS